TKSMMEILKLPASGRASFTFSMAFSRNVSSVMRLGDFCTSCSDCDRRRVCHDNPANTLRAQALFGSVSVSIEFRARGLLPWLELPGEALGFIALKGRGQRHFI